jgi:Nuclease-related domain
VLHDVAIPGSRTNGDHLLIGPPGVFLVDSKAWYGHITLAADGSAWHNVHPMDAALESVRREAEQLTMALGATVLPVLCVHDTHHLLWGELDVAGVRSSQWSRPAGWWPPCGRCRRTWTRSGSCCWPEHARHQLHPAA